MTVLLYFIAIVFFILIGVLLVVLVPSLALWLTIKRLDFSDQSFGKAVGVVIHYLIANIVAGVVFMFLYPIIGAIVALVIPKSIVIYMITILYLILPMLVFMYVVMQEYNASLKTAFLTYVITTVTMILIVAIPFILTKLNII